MKNHGHRFSLFTFIVPIFACLMFALGPTTVVAAKPVPDGCRLQGSWIGYNESEIAYWVSTADGQSGSAGTYRLEAPGFDMTLGGMFATATGGSVLRGMWERIDDYTFGVTVVGLAVDDVGNTLYIIKLSAIDTLSVECESMSIHSTIEFFFGNQDPFDPAATPFYTLYSPPHMGYRMRVDPPAS